MIRRLLPWGGALLAVWILAAFVAPTFGDVQRDILVYSGINIILAVSLNLVNGFTGQFSMGHAGFMSVGAYTSSFLALQLYDKAPSAFEEPYVMFTFAGLILCAGLVAAVMGYIVGLPSLRLRGDYLAIVTLGFGEIIRVVFLNMDAVGGARGIPGIPKLTTLSWVYTVAVITVFFVWRLVTSSHGRGLLAVREDEIAAQSVGVNTTQSKVRAFALGAFFAGTAGALFAHYLTFINPQTFDFNKSFEVIIMVVLGGMGSITGSVVAALILTFLREYLRLLQDYTQVDLRMIIYSLLLIVMMLNRPNGIFGRKEITDIWAWFKAKARAPEVPS